MNSTQLRQEIIESLANLSDDELFQVKEMIKQSFLRENTIQSEEERKQLIRSLQGKYAHVATSSEDFARRKQEEIDWEDRNR